MKLVMMSPVHGNRNLGASGSGVASLSIPKGIVAVPMPAQHAHGK